MCGPVGTILNFMVYSVYVGKEQKFHCLNSRFYRICFEKPPIVSYGILCVSIHMYINCGRLVRLVLLRRLYRNIDTL